MGAELLGVPRGEDVAEVAGRNADVDGASRLDLARGDQLGVARHVVDDLGKQAPQLMELALDRATLRSSRSCRAKSSSENALDARLAVVEVAAHAPYRHVVAGGGDHLLALDVAHAAVGKQHADGDAVGVFETSRARPSPVSPEVATRRSRGRSRPRPSASRRLPRRSGQALQRHVLEGAGGSMPKLEDVGVLVERGYRADALVVEVVAVSLVHESRDALVVEVDVERAVDGCGALAVRELGEFEGCLRGKRRNLFGDIEAAALREAVDDRARERMGSAQTPRVSMYRFVPKALARSVFCSMYEALSPEMQLRLSILERRRVQVLPTRCFRSAQRGEARRALWDDGGAVRMRTFSILGDSISTFSGFVPRENLVFYEGKV